MTATMVKNSEEREQEAATRSVTHRITHHSHDILIGKQALPALHFNLKLDFPKDVNKSSTNWALAAAFSFTVAADFGHRAFSPD